MSKSKKKTVGSKRSAEDRPYTPFVDTIHATDRNKNIALVALNGRAFRSTFARIVKNHETAVFVITRERFHVYADRLFGGSRTLIRWPRNVLDKLETAAAWANLRVATEPLLDVLEYATTLSTVTVIMNLTNATVTMTVITPSSKRPTARSHATRHSVTIHALQDPSECHMGKEATEYALQVRVPADIWASAMAGSHRKKDGVRPPPAQLEVVPSANELSLTFWPVDMMRIGSIRQVTFPVLKDDPDSPLQCLTPEMPSWDAGPRFSATAVLEANEWAALCEEIVVSADKENPLRLDMPIKNGWGTVTVVIGQRG